MKKWKGDVMHVKAREIKLNETDDGLIRIQIFKTGNFDHMYYGEFEITDEILKNMKKNFDDNVRGVDIPINYSHDSGGAAAGWIKDVIVEDGRLFADVEFTEDGRKKIENKEFRYISGEFDENYRDNESGTKYGATLLGAALTNIPFLKGMDAILSEYRNLSDDLKSQLKDFIFEDEKENDMKFDDLKKALSELTPEEKAEIGKTLNLSEPKGDDAEAKKLKEENAALKEKLALQERESEFKQLCDDGKAVPAQKQAYLDGDMKSFMEKAVKINLDEAGTEAAGEEGDDEKSKNKKDEEGDDEKPEGGEDAKTAAEAEEKVAELADEKVSEAKKLGEPISMDTAISRTLSENPKLRKLYEAA